MIKTTIDNILKNVECIKQVKKEYPYVHKAFDNYAANRSEMNNLKAQCALQTVKKHYSSNVYKIYQHVYESVKNKNNNIK